MLEKKEARKIQKERILQIADRDKKEKRILENLKIHLKGKKEIVSYRADRFEADIYSMEMFFPEIRFYYPRIIPGQNRLEFARSDFWTKDRFGLFSPEGGTVLDPVDADLIIVPALGFDENRIRLGRGGGFYDRTLNEAVSARTLGLSFRELFPVNFLSEPHDIAVKTIVFDD